ncbi:MAG: N-acetyl-alpha-D-glucosaminyl L-malate synthase BshA [Flavobacteriales bacterium]|nr:N-acetyl-alpha-D-glucosaminyl L-malate synthase BshA [Flavobacteriales bacterium]
MNIGIVCYPTFGGSGVVATELGKALALKGHQVHFITYQQPVKLDIFTENIYFHEVKVSNYPLFDYQPYELVLTSKLVDVIKFEKLDLLHVHYAIPHASAAYMAQKILAEEGIKIPFITTLHGTDITLVGKDSSFEPVITFSINKSDAVTAVSESLKQDTFDHFDINRDIEVIPNFVCLDEYQYNGSIEALKKSFAPNGEKILVHISNFRKVKRTEDVIRIFDIIRKQLPVKLLMVGDGPERHHLEELCRELGTCDLVKFIGKVKDTERVLAVSDLFILPSETESFGLAALEAMAARTPVISTNTGGIPEVNKNGVSGYLSNIGNIEEMAFNSLKILSNEKTLEQFKEAAYQQAKKFDIHSILPMYEALYERVIKTI